MTVSITEHFVKRAGGDGIFYLASGPTDGPLLIFLHGWPELAISWRHQLPLFGNLGFCAIAPDMPGYGRSVVYKEHRDYRLENIVADMIFLLDSLGAKDAVWIGHDWGSAPVWAIASHHPDRCRAVASLCIPYRSIELGLRHLISTIDRNVYPAAVYPNGQWDYMAFYEENFTLATNAFDANPENMIKALFTRADPAGVGKPALTSDIRRVGGWFGPGGAAAPAAPLDEAVLSVGEFRQYASALRRNGFFGPDAYYMNHERNAEYAARSVNDGYLDIPALFLLAQYDFVCESAQSRLADEMRTRCRNLSSVSVPSGHWMAQEKPMEVNAAISHWLASQVGLWPTLRAPSWSALRN
jgi:pimeloyl-ACP methyl ester carboxylesterase